MSMQAFISANRAEIDAAIDRANPRYGLQRRNDHERRQWVLNDEGLYLWARRQGVNV